MGKPNTARRTGEAQKRKAPPTKFVLTKLKTPLGSALRCSRRIIGRYWML